MQKHSGKKTRQMLQYLRLQAKKPSMCFLVFPLTHLSSRFAGVEQGFGLSEGPF